MPRGRTNKCYNVSNMKKLVIWLKVLLTLQLLFFSSSIFLAYLDFSERTDSQTGYAVVLFGPIAIALSVLNAFLLVLYIYKLGKTKGEMDWLLFSLALLAYSPLVFNENINNWLERVELRN